MFNPMSALAVQHLRGYGLCRSQGIHASCALESCCEGRCQGSECVYTGPPAPTYRQSIMSMRSYTEPDALLRYLGSARLRGTDLKLSSACLWRLRNCVRTHFPINHNCLLVIPFRKPAEMWALSIIVVLKYQRPRIGERLP